MSLIGHVVRSGAELVPWGRDLYLLLARKRLGIAYRGVHASRAAAQAACHSAGGGDYDVVNVEKSEQVEREIAALEDFLRFSDYPLLFWLSRLVRTGSHVLELGGSIGHFYYDMQRCFEPPDGLRWTIAELPAAVELGRAIARRMGASRLEFLDSGALEAAPPVDLFVTAGTLQYMDQGLPEILARLPALPWDVLVSDLPVHATNRFWTQQSLALCEVPYGVESERRLDEQMATLGYRRRTVWCNPRTIEIPFHRSLRIEGYKGYHFSRS